jgi:taurine dioxygenase
VHPVVRTHPATGRKCLYVCEGYTHRILDLPEDESRALLDDLFAHIIKPAFVYRHKWRAGDLLMWDNAAVQHKVSFDYAPPLRRRLERCTVEGSVPY